MKSSPTADQIADRLDVIRATLPASVKLIAVTKQVSPEAMRSAYAAGIRDFGESKLQEAIPKQAELSDLPDITWHLIGHLQSNKAAKAIEHFQWIHSLDSLKLAQRLDHLAAQTNLRPNLCLQVKLLPDPNKYGWTVAELLADLPALRQCRHLNIVGLMTIPPYGLPDQQTSAVFKQTRQLAEQIRQQEDAQATNLQPNDLLIRMEQLSMGMSDDYPLAIAAGATMIRLGRTIFGER